MRLGVNIDHIAYLREVRKINDPDPINALHIAKLAGASQITIHLREDRRHIHDRDVENIMRLSQIPVNIECANEKSILDFICSKKPSRITLVPEKREEVTTEGGLLVGNHLLQTLDFIKNNDIEVALFIDPNKAVIEEVVKLSEQIQSDIALELHTGRYANLYLRNTPLHDHGHHRRVRLRTGLYPAGHPAPSGGMGSAHGEVPESRSGSYLARKMEADDADI